MLHRRYYDLSALADRQHVLILHYLMSSYRPPLPLTLRLHLSEELGLTLWFDISNIKKSKEAERTGANSTWLNQAGTLSQNLCCFEHTVLYLVINLAPSLFYLDKHKTGEVLSRCYSTADAPHSLCISDRSERGGGRCVSQSEVRRQSGTVKVL